MLQEFKEFVNRGNVMDLAVGVIIGAAFTAIVTSLVDDILMPIIGALLGGVNIEGAAITIGTATINYGSFIMAVLTFLLTAVFLFLIIHAANAANRELEELGLFEEEEEAVEEAAPLLSTEERLLTEIRDLLQANLAGEASQGS
jgi:large conductance mechanosensitive channel